jgi:hypothetical protein
MPVVAENPLHTALTDTSNPFRRGDGVGIIPFNFPEEVYRNEGDIDDTIWELQSFLQDPLPDNNYQPHFPRGEYVVMCSNPLLRGGGGSPPIARFHLDSIGGPDFIKTYWLYRTYEDFVSMFRDLNSNEALPAYRPHAETVWAACQQILKDPEPRDPFDEAGLFTFNAWWVTRGARSLKFITQPKFKEAFRGKDIWHFLGFGSFTGALTLSRIGLPTLTDPRLEPFATEIGASEGSGFLFNSAVIPHKGDSAADGSTSTEVRILAIPTAYLNMVRAEQTMFMEPDLDWSNLRVALVPKIGGSTRITPRTTT